MKTLTAITTLAILAISSITTAMPAPIRPPVVLDSRVLSFEVLTEGADIAPEHSKVLMYPSLEVNYATETVSLKYMYAPSCKPGFACPAVMMTGSIDLPIVSKNVSEDGCAVEVIAKQDSRPVDGILQKITIDDFSTSPCAFYAKPISKLQYLTSYYDRVNGKVVTAVSNLQADLIQVSDVLPAGEFFNLTGGEYLKGFKKNEKVSSGNLTIYENTVHLEVFNQSDCPQGAMCIVGPTFLIGDFEIVSREKGACEETITALDQSSGLGVSRRIVIKNYTHSMCEIPYLHAVVVEYTSQVIHPKAKVQQHARFFFDYAIVPFKK